MPPCHFATLRYYCHASPYFRYACFRYDAYAPCLFAAADAMMLMLTLFATARCHAAATRADAEDCYAILIFFAIG